MALTDNLIAYWKLNDDGSGNLSLVDSSGYGNDFENFNTVGLGSSGILGSGNAVFSGSDQQYLITSNDIIGSNFGLGAFSVSAWVNLSSYTTPFCGIWLFSNPRVFLLINSNGHPLLINGGSAQALNNYTLPLNTWVNFVFVRNSSNQNADLYANGNFVGTFNITTNVDYDYGFGIIGTANDGLGNFNPVGAIDEVGLWNRALSTDEINVIYSGGEGTTYPFPDIFYYNNSTNDGNLSNLSNWWMDSSHTTAANSLPDSNKDVCIQAISTTGSLNCKKATIYANIGSGATIAANNILLSGSAINSGTLNGSVALSGSSRNLGTINGNATFSNSTSNNGTINGNATAYYPVATIAGTITGSTTYSWVNGSGLWNGEVWIGGSISFIIPDVSDVRSGVSYGPASSPYTGTLAANSGSSQSNDINIGEIIGLPYFIQL